MVWGLFNRMARPVVSGMGAITGVDANRMIDRLVADGVMPEVAEDLTFACEVGFLKAQREKVKADED